ncbi:MAG: PhoH family protein [Pseudomonadota bacterium]
MTQPDPTLPRRTYVLDTNVLLYDPSSLHAFDEHDLVLPITVIEEIDKFKRDLNETGRNARTISRTLDKLRESGSLAKGVPLPGGGTLVVDLGLDTDQLPSSFLPNSNDNRILATVLRLSKKRPLDSVFFVTRDVNMRLKGDALGIHAEDYQHAHIRMDERYVGVTERDAPEKVIQDLYQRGWVSWEDTTLYGNQFVVLKASDRADNQSAMARYDARQQRLVRVQRQKDAVWGIYPRNKEQIFALDLLLDDSVRLVTLDGIAGTGKTLIAIACGLQKVADEGAYRRLVVARPIFPLGRDVGFLPGDIGEKLNPWMKPIFDNLELLLNGDEEGGKRRGAPTYQPLLDQKIIEVEPLTYIRGRSIPRQYLVIDEAQNLTPHEVKTVITRAGEGTKVVLTGDPYQIDNPYVDATSNGLTYVVENFKGQALAGHVTLRKGERSELAELAAQLL